MYITFRRALKSHAGSMADEPLPGRCANHLKLVYAFATARFLQSLSKPAPLFLVHGATLLGVYSLLMEQLLASVIACYVAVTRLNPPLPFAS